MKNFTVKTTDNEGNPFTLVIGDKVLKAGDMFDADPAEVTEYVEAGKIVATETFDAAPDTTDRIDLEVKNSPSTPADVADVLTPEVDPEA